MLRKTTLFALPLALVGGVAFSSPTLAQGIYSPYEMRVEIGQLDQRIERIARSDRFTNSELRRMRNAVDTLETSFRQSGRDGFTRGELAGLSERIDNVRARISQQARDGDRLRRR